MNNTIFLVLINLFCYLEQDHFSKYLSNYKLFAPYLILEKGEYLRMIASNIFHLNFPHFFFNMIGFYKISSIIEMIYGKKYWIIIFVIGIFSNIINILISLLGIYFYKNYYTYYTHYLGLSNIIFGIRALYYHKLNTNVVVFGQIVNSRYVVWIELFFVNFLIPNSSFLGHLSGITSGLLLSNIL